MTIRGDRWVGTEEFKQARWRRGCVFGNSDFPSGCEGHKRGKVSQSLVSVSLLLNLEASGTGANRVNSMAALSSAAPSPSSKGKQAMTSGQGPPSPSLHSIPRRAPSLSTGQLSTVTFRWVPSIDRIAGQYYRALKTAVGNAE